MLFQVLKQLNPTDWEKEGWKWEEVAFEDYEQFFSIEPFSNLGNLVGKNLIDAQEK